MAGRQHGWGHERALGARMQGNARATCRCRAARCVASHLEQASWREQERTWSLWRHTLVSTRHSRLQRCQAGHCRGEGRRVGEALTASWSNGRRLPVVRCLAAYQFGPPAPNLGSCTCLPVWSPCAQPGGLHSCAAPPHNQANLEAEAAVEEGGLGQAGSPAGGDGRQLEKVAAQHQLGGRQVGHGEAQAGRRWRLSAHEQGLQGSVFAVQVHVRLAVASQRRRHLTTI